MGEAATGNADYVVVTSDNPRSEDPQSIIEDIKPGLKGKAFEIQVDRKKAIAAVLKKAKKGDAVLLAGKGAESYQEVKGERQPFNDIETARAILAEMGYKGGEAREEN
jgi:UDP-N-acetylmuramoyl-L-alanyl-D-glutamate--2,6-diaminopimelate ligase